MPWYFERSRGGLTPHHRLSLNNNRTVPQYGIFCRHLRELIHPQWRSLLCPYVILGTIATVNHSKYMTSI